MAYGGGIYLGLLWGALCRNGVGTLVDSSRFIGDILSYGLVKEGTSLAAWSFIKMWFHDSIAIFRIIHFRSGFLPHPDTSNDCQHYMTIHSLYLYYNPPIIILKPHHKSFNFTISTTMLSSTQKHNKQPLQLQNSKLFNFQHKIRCSPPDRCTIANQTIDFTLFSTCFISYFASLI